MRILGTLVVVFLWGSGTWAGDPRSLKDALEDHALADSWIYEDIEAGYRQALESGKPLLVSLRCVP